MPAIVTSWLVGYTTLDEQTPQIGVGDITVTADTYALRHATASLSLIDTIAAQLTAAYGAGYSVEILQNRLVRITLGVAGVITWGPATALRDLLGFTGDRGAALTHTANNPSPLLWSPGYPASPTTIAGVAGYTVSHQSRYKADDGSQLYTAHYGDETWQELAWSHIVPSRLRVTPSVGGTFHELYEQCLKLGRRVLHHESMTEDLASTTAVTWSTALGPYALRDTDGNWYKRNVANADISSPLSLPLMRLDEVA